MFTCSRVRPSMHGIWIGSVLVLALVASATPARAERRLSLAQAVDLALQQNPELRLEEAKISEAEATRKSTRGLYGPKLMLEGNLMVWDDALTFDLEMPDISLSPESVDFNEIIANAGLTPQEAGAVAGNLNLVSGMFKMMGPLFGDMFSSLDFGNIRDQVTGQISVTLAQPLTPLLQIHNGYTATRRMVDAARMDKESKKVDVAHKVSDLYLKLMQANQFVEVAQTGVDQVAAHLRQARHFHVAGLIGKQQVLKAQLELARAKERVIKARTGATLASSALAMHLGLSIDEKIVPTEKVTDPPRPVSESLQQAVREAAEERTELRSMQLKEEAARAGQRRAKWDLIPSVSAVAAYQHTEGQGTFMPKNAFFFGGILKWDVWDWGHKYYAMRAAGEKARQAELGQRLLQDGIRIQAKKAYLELKQSEEALTVARAAIKEAEENFRIEQSRFEANANTSTDVLDAQLALTRAKLSYTTALYGYYIAQRALLRAMGRLR